MEPAAAKMKPSNNHRNYFPRPEVFHDSRIVKVVNT